MAGFNSDIVTVYNGLFFFQYILSTFLVIQCIICSSVQHIYVPEMRTNITAEECPHADHTHLTGSFNL